MSRIILTLRMPLLAVLLGVVGCGQRFGTVEGTVTIDGKPANNGSVIFSAGKYSASGTIKSDGTYVAENVPAGEVKVAILQMLGRGGRAGPLKGIPGAEDPGTGPTTKPIIVPKKYQNVETSGLTHTATSGRSTFNIELSSK